MKQNHVPQGVQASRDQFEIVFQHAPTGLCLVGLDGRILSANPAMRQMVGYSESELLERSVFDITHEEDRALSADGAVNQNQGHIEVNSELGHGTTFEIYLSRVDEPAEHSPAKSVATTTAGHETIVFVEDDAAVRILGERVLARHGYKVHAFANGSEALAAVRAMMEPIDLVVTDVVMPGMNGRALSVEVRKIRPEVKVLFTSGYTRNVIAHHGVLEPGVEFMAKPYSSEVLARRVREVLG